MFGFYRDICDRQIVNRKGLYGTWVVSPAIDFRVEKKARRLRINETVLKHCTKVHCASFVGYTEVEGGRLRL